MPDAKNDEVVEAVLFLAGRFFTIQDLIKYTNINPLMIKESIQRLKEKYSDHSTIQIIERDNSYKMDVRTNCSHLINKIATGSTEFTRAEQETLAVIAYKQPITQAIVVKIRGNKSYDHIKNLIQAGLIRAKKAGRTIELHTDESFYDYFNIEKKDSENLSAREKEQAFREDLENLSSEEINLSVRETAEKADDKVNEEDIDKRL